MAKSDKVLKALPIANMIQRISQVRFIVVSRNGFYASMGDEILMEFDNLQDAKNVVDSLNLSIAPVLDNFRVDYESRLGALLA